MSAAAQGEEKLAGGEGQIGAASENQETAPSTRCVRYLRVNGVSDGTA